MFKDLISFWKGKDFLTQVFDDFKGMLEKSQDMFTNVCQALLENVENPNLRAQVYAIDKEVNLLEKDIRKRIIEHLSLQPSVNTSFCLLLMSVVKDAERLGDYSKNLYEVSEILEKPIDKETFTLFFNGIDKEILGLFEQTKDAFIGSDDTKAVLSFGLESKIAKRCDDILVELAKSDLSLNEGICYALIARHFKRITAHLVNIATSVVLPLSEIDYFDERNSDE